MVCFACLGLLAAFVALTGAAMRTYPGGTWHDPRHEGHHFWHNFLCDLLRRQGLDGRPNPVGARLALLGMLAMAGALLAYFWLAPEVLRAWPGLARVTRWAGVAAALGLALVTLLPSDRFGGLHTLAIVAAAGPGVVAGTLAVVGVVLGPGAPAWLRALGVTLWALLIATSAVFVRHTWFGGGLLRLLPVLQRLTAIAAVGWVAGGVLWLLLRGPG